MPDDPKTEIDDLADILDILGDGKSKVVEAPKLAMTEAEDNFDDILETLGQQSVKPAAAPSPTPASRPSPSTDDDQLDFMGALGLAQSRTVPDITKPWMKHHNFVLVKTVEEVNKIVDDALACKKCSLDLETEGLDNRIFYDAEGKPYTKHKIVGYCLSVGDAKTGYYVPVRHTPTGDERDLNVKPLADVEAAITRLCKASQPVLKADCKDLLAGKEIETPPRVVIDFWHASFDQEFLYPITGIDFWHPESFEDGSLACFVVFSADRHLGLKGKAEEKLRDPEGHPYEMIELKELFPIRGREIEFHTLSPDEPGVVKYACSDAICTRLLGEDKTIMPLCKERYSFTYRLEKQVAQVKRVMERNRVKLDRVRINELKATHEAAIASIREKIVSLASSKGFNGFEPGSPKQLGEFLFTEKGLDISPKPDKTANGQFKTDWTTLEELTKELGEGAPPILKWVIEYREEEKLLGTYLESMSKNLDRNDEMRFQFKQTGAATGRFSAPAGDADHGYSGIPIHGIPATSDLRTCFIARDTYTMLKCDYAGQELRIVTNLSNEPVWIKEFLEGDGDLHTITAMAFYNKPKEGVTKDERKGGKIANFALIYGGGPQAIMRATGCDKIEGARRKQAFDKSVSTFAGWVKGQHQRVKKELGVWTAFARWIAIPDANIQPGQADSNGRRADEAHSKMVRASCERQATNYPIQGCLCSTARVLTSQGYKTVAEIVADGGTGQTWTGTNWADFSVLDKGEWQHAEIELEDGTIIPCDTRHKLLVVTDNGYEWREYEELRSKDRIATSLAKPVQFHGEPLPMFEVGEKSNLTQSMPEGCETDLWFWLGYYFGDGWKDDQKGCLNYVFGDHETAMMDRCVGFWSRWGLNPKVREATHQPAEKMSTRYHVDIWSVDLARWLSKLGINQSDAHTKRLPSRIFCEPLLYRQHFIKGLIASDGHKSTEGDPYSIHLCQAPLLRDTKLLLRTVGVESSLYGPYDYTDKYGQTFTSYRLDINQRMFRAAVEGTPAMLPAFKKMNAPPFLVRAFIDKYPKEKASSFPNESLYVLYLRMRGGGTVTLTTFQHMLDTMGYRIEQPVYGFKCLKEKRELLARGPTYTLSVNDPLHRFEAEGVITKNSGADIMKIAMVVVHKEFAKRGWLKVGGDDSCRMLLTVHDEIVFEIRHDRVIEAVPIIVEAMESPTKMARPPYSPLWKVHLITEPLVGPTWGTGYPCERYKDGHKVKEGEVVAGGFVYGTIRVVDMNKDGTPKDKPVAGEVIHKEDKEKKKVHIRFDKPLWLEHVGAVSEPMPGPKGPGDNGGGPSSPPTPPASGGAPSAPPPATLAEVSGKKNGVIKIASLRLKTLSTGSIKQVRMICARFLDPDHGDILQVIDPSSGKVVIDPMLGIRVETDQVAAAMLELNLSDGKVHYSS